MFTQFPFDVQECFLKFELPDHLIIDAQTAAAGGVKEAGGGSNSSDGKEASANAKYNSPALGPIGRVLSDVELELEHYSQLLSSEYESDEWLLVDLIISLRDYEFMQFERNASTSR